jgi:hypothetical protein
VNADRLAEILAGVMNGVPAAAGLGFVLLIVDDRAAEVEIAYRSDLDDDEAAEVLERTIGMLRGEGTQTGEEVA